MKTPRLHQGNTAAEFLMRSLGESVFIRACLTSTDIWLDLDWLSGFLSSIDFYCCNTEMMRSLYFAMLLKFLLKQPGGYKYI